MATATAKPPHRARKRRGTTNSKTVSAETSTPTKPTGDKSAADSAGEITRVEELRMMHPSCLVDHPANPRHRVLPPNVADLMELIEAYGQREPVRARVIDENQAQILSGHRRVAACRILDRDVRVELVVCDDAEALREVMLGNAERKDLDPIERAELLQTMIDAGADRDEAGAMFGLMSDSGIKNALRLMQLPESIKKLLRDGTIPARNARYLIPFCAMPKVLDDFAKRLTDKCGDELGYFLNNPKESVELLINTNGDPSRKYSQQVDARPIDGSTYRIDYNYEDAKCGFEVTPELRKKLKVVEVPIDGKMTEVATNVKLFDKLNAEHLVKKSAYGGQAKKKKPAKSKTTELTAAQKKAEADRKRKEAAERLKKSLPVWACRFQRAVLSMDTPEGSPVIQASLPWLVAQMQSDSVWVTRGCETQVGKAKMKRGYGGWSIHATKDLQAMLDAEGVSDRIWRVILWPQHREGWLSADGIADEGTPVEMPMNPKASNSFHKVWPMLVAASGVSLADAWKRSTRPDSGPLCDLVREYLSLHNAEQLGRLARQAKCKTTETGKGKLVEALMQHHLKSVLPMPKILATRGKKS